MPNESIRSVIVCAGSLHYDILVESSRLPDLGETLPANRWIPKFGGKGGNQAVAAARHGSKVRLLSAVGNDPFGGMLRKSLSDTGIDDSFVLQLENPTGMSVAITDDKGDYGAVTVTGANARIPVGTASEPALWANAGTLMLQNEIDSELNLALAEEARSRRMTVVMNVAPSGPINKALSDYIDIVIFNALEARQFMGGDPIKTIYDAYNSLNHIREYFSAAIITAGAEGVAAYSSSTDIFIEKGIKVNAKNSHGAGDVFAGTFCAELAFGSDLVNAVKVANKVASSFVAGNYGTA
ncbi:MAG: PfkB family carbohydrate kinase [Albidovulum sp.]|nr:PfkB family carbohydrate kinase [Albidovulum sp.]